MKRWTETNNPAAGTTCVISVAAAGGSRHVIEQLLVSQRNQTAAAYTATLTVRDSSIGGTVLAQQDFLTGAAAMTQGNPQIEVRGLHGNAVVAHFAPPAASVTQKITAAGHTEEGPY